jgi:heavy-metal resistance protein
MKFFKTIVCCGFLLMAFESFARAEFQNPSEDELKLIKLRDRAIQDALKHSASPEELVRLQAELQKLEMSLAQKRADSAVGVPLKSAPASPLTTLQATVKGAFWRNPEWISMLELSADQQKKMDDIFQQYRLKLIDLNASLQKEELILEPLLGGTKPSADAEAKIMSQVDRIAEARAELEKANSRMLVNILQVLNTDQWNKLPMPARIKPLK